MKHLLLALLLSLPLPGAVNFVVTGPATTPTGQTVTASFAVSGDPTPSLQFRVPLGSTVSAGAGALAAGKTLSCADTPTDRLCLIVGENNTAITGEVAVVVFPAQSTPGSTTLAPTGLIVSNDAPATIAAIVDLTALNIDVLSPCDLTQDGSIDILDVDAIVQQALGNAACSNDINSDGLCDIIDAQIVANVGIGLLSCPL